MDLQAKDIIYFRRGLILTKGGIYSFLNKVSGKQFIGSAKYLYLILNEHLSNRKSNALQTAISKYGLDNFIVHMNTFLTIIKLPALSY